MTSKEDLRMKPQGESVKHLVIPSGTRPSSTRVRWQAVGNVSGDTAVSSQQIEDRANQMLEIYASRHFHSVRAAQNARLRILLWVIRSKVIANVKRAFDLVVASLALLVVLPVMAIIAIAIKLDSPGPIIFRQERVGRWGVPFACYKFRSMTADAESRKAALLAQNESDGVVFKMRNDPRVTRVGRFIRKFSLDELPQLFNVLKGDMSLVGPRPQIPHEVEQYEFDHFRRLAAVPGITGLQQVSGRSDLNYERWIELDLRYVAEQSLWQDIRILILTIPAVILGRGAY